MEQGRVALEGAPDEVLARTDVLGRLNLEVPFACRLSTALRERDACIPVCIRENALADAIVQAADSALLSKRCEAAKKNAIRDASKSAAADNTPAAGSSPAENPTAGSASAPNEALAAATDSVSMTDARKNIAPFIEFDHVSHTYLDASRAKKNRSKKHDKQAKWGNDPNAVWALHDATFSIAKGEFVGIAGHTGSGKSTLIQHMNGILKPTCGRVLVEGKDIADKKEANIARSKVGVVFQYPERQLFAATVYDDVAFGPRNMGLDEHEIDLACASRLHESTSISKLSKTRAPSSFPAANNAAWPSPASLAMRPSVLVLDEPTAGLDPAARRDFLALISSLHRKWD